MLECSSTCSAFLPETTKKCRQFLPEEDKPCCEFLPKATKPKIAGPRFVFDYDPEERLCPVLLIQTKDFFVCPTCNECVSRKAYDKLESKMCSVCRSPGLFEPIMVKLVTPENSFYVSVKNEDTIEALKLKGEHLVPRDKNGNILPSKKTFKQLGIINGSVIRG